MVKLSIKLLTKKIELNYILKTVTAVFQSGCYQRVLKPEMD